MRPHPSARILLVVGLSAGLVPALSAPAQTRAERESLKHATDLSLAFQYATRVIAPSVVNIVATQRQHAARGDGGELQDFLDRFGWPGGDRRGSDDRGDDSGRLTRGQGSGVIIRPDGHILTNFHVVEDAVKLRVTLFNGRHYEAEIVGTDAETDLALIKIDIDNLTAASFGDSDEVQVGQWVLAVGNPFGLDSTVTAGIISAKGRGNMGLAEYGNLLQTDAAINPGNSGGPLVNLRGEILGINNAITTTNGGYQGIGFAVPGNMANSVVQSLLRTGEVVRGWLGITMRPILQDEAQEAGLEGRGVLIIDVSEGSPAAVAGLQLGDVITALNGREVTNSSQLQNAVARRTPGTVVRMTVLRDGRDRDVPVTLGERPPLGELQLAQMRAQPSEVMGLIVQELTPERAEELDISSRTGVEVLVVVPDGFADDVGIKQGDVIIGLDRQPIESLDDFRRATEQLDLDNPVHIRLQRGRATFSVEIE